MITTALMKEHLAEYNEDILFADGFDHCVIGIAEQFGKSPVVVYDKAKVLTTLMSNGMTYEDATEHYEYNMLGSFLGDSTPIYLILLSELFDED